VKKRAGSDGRLNRNEKRKRSANALRDGKSRPLVLTIGHSTRAIEDFIGLLQAHKVVCVADVRTIPRSRHNPQFNEQSLPKSLKKAGIGYIHMAGLGGLRHTSPDSPNMGWRNASFRGFADYMQRPEFTSALEGLIELAKRRQVALMCAEAVPWRCHRSLIADALVARGIHAEHIMSPTRRQVHAVTRFAKVRGTHVTYPPLAESTEPLLRPGSRTRSNSKNVATKVDIATKRRTRPRSRQPSV
jgi:hypothetical protein